MEIAISLPCLVLASVGLIFLFPLIVLLGRLYRRPTLKDFANGRRRVLVTGTDTGFGRELALTLANRLGITVYAGCLTEEGERDLRADASSADRLKTIRLDVTDPASVDKARRYIEEDLRDAGIDGLWGLVNNAGIIRGHLFPYASLADYRAVMEVNFFGVVRMTEAFLPLVIKCRGRIVNVISIASRYSCNTEPCYASSKYALQPYTDCLRRHLNMLGCHAASIEPGVFLTKFDAAKYTDELNQSWAEMTSEMRHQYGQEFHEAARNMMAKIGKKTPLNYFNRTSMVIESMVHALSAQRPKSRYVVGMDARFYYLPLGLMPDWVIDFLYRKRLPFHGLVATRVRLQQSLEEQQAQSKTTSKSHLPASSSNKKEL